VVTFNRRDAEVAMAHDHVAFLMIALVAIWAMRANNQVATLRSDILR
jgi:hypothetical protein